MTTAATLHGQTYRYGRRITTVYEGAEVETETGEVGRRTVEVDSYHSPHRRCYGIAVRLSESVDGMKVHSMFSTYAGTPTSAPLGGSHPAVRYSARTLEALHADAVRTFEAMPDDDPIREWAAAWLEGRSR